MRITYRQTMMNVALVQRCTVYALCHTHQFGLSPELFDKNVLKVQMYIVVHKIRGSELFSNNFCKS